MSQPGTITSLAIDRFYPESPNPYTVDDLGEYEYAAQSFCCATGTRIEIIGTAYASMPWDTDGTKRHIFKVRMTVNDGDEYVFDFGQSIACGAATPGAYDILASIYPEPDVQSVDDLIQNYGYEINSEADYLRLQQTAAAIRKQTKWLESNYTEDQLTQLCDIS